MKKLIKQDGFLTEDGEEFLKPFLNSLMEILSSPEVSNMNVTEVRVLGGVLSNKIGKAVANTILERNNQTKQSNKFSEMTDAQFRQYLENKYGPEWQFMTLTKEEFERVPTISKEQMEELMKQKAPLECFISGVKFDR